MWRVLGGTRVMLGRGIGSELRQPLGYAIVGGLLVSQVLTLFTTPVVYIYMDRLGNWLGRRRQATQPEANVPAPQSSHVARAGPKPASSRRALAAVRRAVRARQWLRLWRMPLEPAPRLRGRRG